MSPKHLTATVLLLIFLTTKPSSALNILVLGAVQTRSHFTYANAVTTALLEQGHHIYELTSLEPKHHPNRTSFVIKDAILDYQYDLEAESEDSLISMVYRLAQWSVLMCNLVFESQAAADLLALARSSKRPHIDVVVHDYIFHQCLGAFVPEFGNPPVVAITAYGNSIEIDDLVGGPTFPSFVPHDLVPYPPDKPMTWLQRLHNKIIYVWGDIVRAFYHYPEMDAAAKKFFGQNASTVVQYREKVAVALVNSHPAFHGARPQLPAVIPIGGIHIAPPKELPAGDLKTFVDSAKDGLILMSFGSVVKTSAISPSRRKGLMKAFARLSPRKVLLKWEYPWDVEADGPIPDNVLISPWFPQTDILAHPNIRVFVTHCGGLSTNEVIRRPVPIVAVPFFMDQYINANHLVAMETGRMLLYPHLNEDTLYETIKDVLEDKRYLTRLQRLSALIGDEITTPRERVVYWVEFVGRHGGAAHLHSPGRLLPWFSRWMIDDVIILPAATLFLGLLVHGICRCCSRGSSDSETKRKIQ